MAFFDALAELLDLLDEAFSPVLQDALEFQRHVLLAENQVALRVGSWLHEELSTSGTLRMERSAAFTPGTLDACSLLFKENRFITRKQNTFLFADVAL